MPAITPKEAAVMLWNAGVPASRIACRLGIKAVQVEKIIAARRAHALAREAS